ncbi:MAG TPA: NADH-quinone oxidoreductase subunit M [Armatimonadota bacterium]|nr:NADH-quinone oxidoreductase subunit M [Armatimonadota bacterium]
MTPLTQYLTQTYALAWLVLIPLAASLLLMAMPKTWALTIRIVSAVAAGITLVISGLLIYDYWTLVHTHQVLTDGTGVFSAIWRYDNPALSRLIHFGPISFHLATDGAGVAMCFLTALTITAGVFASWNLQERTKEYLALLLLLVAGVFGVFVAADLFFFFLFYEIAVLPMYLLIGIWGTGQKEYAAMKLTLMLLLGSALIFVGFLALYAKGGSFDLFQLAEASRNGAFSSEFQKWFFLAFYLGFGVLAGIFPFHTWSPDGHASAPTATSMLHAGVLMKLGGFGLLRVALPLLPNGLHYWHWMIAVIATINIVYGAFSAMGQRDLKYVIAYSSVSHLGMVMLGMSAGTVTAVNGAVFQMFAHGIMTALFFALVGLVYAKAHTRDIDAMGGLARVAPGLAVAFTIAGLSSFGLPGTGGFIAEFLVYMGTFLVKPWIAAIACTGILITSIYVLRLLRRVFFGQLNPKLAHLEDAKTTEWVALALTSCVIISVGVWPKPMIDIISSSVQPVVNLIGHLH